MEIFVTGATRVLGRPVVQALVDGGHRVRALSRSEENAAALRELGANPVAASLFEVESLQPAATLHSTLDAEVAVASFAGNERRGISLRLGAFYGPESPATWEFLSYARRGIGAFPGSLDAYLPQIWVRDVASAIVAALTQP